VIQSKAGDIAVSGSAMANHLRNLRGLRGGNHRNVLKNVPHFSMHIIRSTMEDFLLDHTTLPAGTASLMINHAFPGDRRSTREARPRHEAVLRAGPAHPAENGSDGSMVRRIA
jgi:hypothetical protein